MQIPVSRVKQSAIICGVREWLAVSERIAA